MHYQHRKTVFMNSIACRRHLMNLATTWLHAITVSRTIVSLLLLFKHSYRSISYLLCYPPCWGENWDCRSRDTGNSSLYVFRTNGKTRLWVVLNFVLSREICFCPYNSMKGQFRSRIHQGKAWWSVQALIRTYAVHFFCYVVFTVHFGNTQQLYQQTHFIS